MRIYEAMIKIRLKTTEKELKEMYSDYTEDQIKKDHLECIKENLDFGFEKRYKILSFKEVRK